MMSWCYVAMLYTIAVFHLQSFNLKLHGKSSLVLTFYSNMLDQLDITATYSSFKMYERKKWYLSRIAVRKSNGFETEEGAGDRTILILIQQTLKKKKQTKVQTKQKNIPQLKLKESKVPTWVLLQCFILRESD